MKNPQGRSWIIVVGCLLGMIVGGFEGIREYRSAVDADLLRGGPGDYLPVGIPILAFLGVLTGAFLGALGQIVWALVQKSMKS